MPTRNPARRAPGRLDARRARRPPPPPDPGRIQDFVDALAYRAEDDPGSPRRVLAERRANCYDGALFAAAALRRLGPPAAARGPAGGPGRRPRAGRLPGAGALGRGGQVQLRRAALPRAHLPRRPRAGRSYFEDYFNLRGEKTLRNYSVPFDLSRLDALDWTFRDDHLREIAGRLDGSRHHRLLTPAMERALRRVDARSLQAGMVGTDLAGVHAGP